MRGGEGFINKKKMQLKFIKSLVKVCPIEDRQKYKMSLTKAHHTHKPYALKTSLHHRALKSKEKAKISKSFKGQKNTIKKSSSLKSNKIHKEKLHQKANRIPYAIKNSADQYGRLEDQKESDENYAVLASEEGTVIVGRVLVGSKKSKQTKLKFDASKDKLNVEARLDSSNQKLSYIKQTTRKDHAHQRKMNQQKRSIKKSYSKDRHSTFNSGIKERIRNTVKEIKTWAAKGLKKCAIYLMGPIFIFVIFFMMMMSVVQSFSGAVSTVVATSYQSSDQIVTNADVMYSRLEADLLYAIHHVERDHSGYDEYRYFLDAVGHDPHLLIAYLTARFGEFSDLDSITELSRIFDLHYKYQLINKVEVRYRTVTHVWVNPETGEMIVSTSQEAYNWHILEVKLSTRNLDQILRSRLNDDEKDLYDTLNETKGNFISFPSPIKEDWRNAVSSPFGYRLDPISKEVSFHEGIDIAKPMGTELMAIVDGNVLNTGYDADGYGHYVVIEAKKSKQTVLYGHCQSLLVRQGDQVKKGQTIALMGSSGRSTGSHVHLEIREASGSKLNPYFYLSWEHVDN